MRTRKAQGTEKNNTKRLGPLLRKYNWRCHWCSRVVIRAPSGINQNKYKPPPNMATVDHLYDRLDIRRNLDQYARVLSCFECNQKNQSQHSIVAALVAAKLEIFDIRDLLNHDYDQKH